MPSSSDRLSAAQKQLLKSVQHLQDAQVENLNEYANAQDDNERKRIMDKMKKNEVLRANLLGSASAASDVVTTAALSANDAEHNIQVLVTFAEQRLKEAEEQVDAAQRDYNGKKRMIDLNTYYGKRFMAQAGVMKIFIYMCIPVLILAVLANMGLLPNYIAGFIIIAIVVIGIIYIYAAVHDINRRDKMNFDEYEWEFDPSRVGPIVNPNYGSTTGSATGSGNIGCYNGNCCGSSTNWDSSALKCVPNPGPTTAPTGASSRANSVYSSQPHYLLGDLNAPN
uniref:Uncharacterized protein n=1 Tax=viral metagenome TaxID=1070528 RepID=A0A6C0I533_9ZZZZ